MTNEIYKRRQTELNIIQSNVGTKNNLSICNVYLYYILNPHKDRTAAARAEPCILYIDMGRCTTDRTEHSGGNTHTYSRAGKTWYSYWFTTFCIESRDERFLYWEKEVFCIQCICGILVLLYETVHMHYLFLSRQVIRNGNRTILWRPHFYNCHHIQYKHSTNIIRVHLIHKVIPKICTLLSKERLINKHTEKIGVVKIDKHISDLN